jgi:hypothetical protein
MAYNFTPVTQANTTLQLMDALDVSIFGGMFFFLLVIAAGAIIIINLAFYKAKDFMLYGAFFISIISGLLWIAGLVPFVVAIGAMCLLVLAVLGFFTTK